MKKIIAGNWKMNLNVSDSSTLIKEILKEITTTNENLEVVVAPSYLAVDAVSKILKENNSSIKLSVQDAHWQEEGAYTGKVAVSMLADLGVSYSLVGHSEQRLYFNETDQTVNNKTKQLLKYNITPIVCIGETLEERESEQFEEVILSQLKLACNNLSSEEVKKLVIAYEPVWAIGTGKIPSFEQIADIHQLIKSELKNLCKSDDNLPAVLYGGSVKPENAKEIMNIQDVDGVLVGGASLKAKDFSQIASSAL